ncbi:GNAT family N-acetyltransferase [Candidatus Moduliflexota bacterium]
MLKVKYIDNTDEFLGLEKVWNKTLSESGADTVFLSWEWVSNWWKTYGAEKELRVIVVSDSAGEVVGIAPLYQRLRRVLKGIAVREVCFLGTGEDVSPDYPDFMVRSGSEGEVMRAMLESLKDDNRWDILNLTDMSEKTINVGLLLETSKGLDLNARAKACATCPYILLPETWEKYLAGLSSNTRYNVRRRTRNLERDFTVKFYLWTDRERLSEAMERLASLHGSRWEERGTSRSFVSPEYRSFHRMVAGDFMEKGFLHMSCLELNGEIAGMYYDYFYNNKIYYYQAGFDPSFSKYSPGLVLRAYVIKRAIEEGVREIDLLKGSYQFKDAWANRSRSTVTINIGKRNLAGRIFFFDAYDKKNLKAAVKNRLPAAILRLVQ